MISNYNEFVDISELQKYMNENEYLKSQFNSKIIPIDAQLEKRTFLNYEEQFDKLFCKYGSFKIDLFQNEY